MKLKNKQSTAGICILQGSERLRKRRRSKGGSRSKQMNNSAATNGSVELDVLDCGICMDPLEPPVFQCLVGHVICASCHDRLPNKSRCHTCSAAGGYHRCIALEKVLEAVRVPCSNAVHGCAAMTRYHERAGHERSCPLRQLRCQEDGCDFAGSTSVLLDMEHILEHVLTDHVVAALSL